MEQTAEISEITSPLTRTPRFKKPSPTTISITRP
jgi:hypothetical protein